MAIRVKSVNEGSPAERAGILPEMLLLEADGNPLNDMLDYEFYTAAARVALEVQQGTERKTLIVDKGEYEPLGCEFATYLIDEKHSCSNHCMFCFIDQLPPGLRDTLYFKDDDERLSFLYGNYITLTNLSPHEVERIMRMHISPINISVHTTNPELRVRMTANKRAGEVLAYLERFAQAGISMNFQLVVCRGINDGDELRRTLGDLLELGDAVESIAAVPIGLTRYREKLYPLTTYDKESAAQVLGILEEYGDRCLEEWGRRVIFPADEWYLEAGRPLPDYDYYEDYAQLENGVGMWRMYREDFLDALEEAEAPAKPLKWDLVTGTLAAPLIRETTAALCQKYPGVEISVHPIQNNFFG
ncbi:MAG: DUF512 domain-containing protein, partial [Oscillospiraceae bacterium]|nr:DUF512 domain-containing protein [Oscillospiraceae bacterium]